MQKPLYTISLAAFLSVALLFCTGAHAADKKTKETAITIYSKAGGGAVSPDMYRPLPGGQMGWTGSSVPGYAIVHEKRAITLPEAKSTVQFTDVAALIDPTTVTFASLTDPSGTKVIEQNYLFDLVNGEKLLERYVGENIKVDQVVGDKVESVSGKLLSAAHPLVLEEVGGKITSLGSYQNIRFPELPGGLITKPTLSWQILTKKTGDHMADVSYETAGITWWADYNAVFTDGKDANSGILKLSSWVSIVNQSGASYDNAKLKLVAGDVNRAQAPQPVGRYMAKAATMELADAVAPNFEEKSFFEFHLYTLSQPTTIPMNTTKQMELFPSANNIAVEKRLVYNGALFPYYGGFNSDRNYGAENGNKKVDVYLAFKNSEENGLGIPLPAGRLRINKVDSDDNTQEFIGEDRIDHTAKNEEVLIKMGNAFDVVGERKQVDFQVDNTRKWMKETIEITLRNHKKSDVKVTAHENLYRAANWKITNESEKYEKKDANTIEFTTNIPKDGEKKIRYSVEYSW
ncbi:MAG: DUF4139 domain-containing protein [Proteobacteria bacterium]|nr:DUF4139 domain-containing protein [Pseudomonadota bacterium]